MNDELSKALIREVQAQNAVLIIIAEHLASLAQAAAPESPDFKRPLSAYANFDWSSIDAQPAKTDRQGPSQVVWNGHLWTRRSGSGKFGKAIWYSRVVGRDGDDNNRYGRLITFKNYDDAAEIDFEPPRPPETPPQPPQKEGGETPDGGRQPPGSATDLLALLNKTAGVQGYYTRVADMSQALAQILGQFEGWPAAEDTVKWREYFVLLREHARAPKGDSHD